MLKDMLRDDIITYPDLQNTGQPIRDKMFNFVVHRYKKNNHPWKKSDQRVWGGFIYHVLDLAFIILWVGAFWLIINGSLNRVGFEKTLFVVAVIFLIRINSVAKQLVKLNRKF